MGDSNATSNVTGNLINVVKGIKSFDGEKPEDFSYRHKKASFILSMQRPDIFAVMEGQPRSVEDTDGAGTDGADTGVISPGLLATGGTLQQRQAAFDRANQDLYTIMYLVTAEAAALLVSTHAYNERGTRGDGQKAIKELEETYLRVTDETIRTLQATLAVTTMKPNEDPDYYFIQAKRLRSRLTAVNEPITDRHFKDIIIQGLPEKCRDIELTTYKDPDFDLKKIQSTMRNLYLDELSRNKGKGGLIAERGVTMSVGSAADSDSIICHNCGKAGQERLRRAWEEQ